MGRQSRFWKKSGGVLAEAMAATASISLDLEVLRRGLAAIADELVLDVLAFVQGAQPSALDRGNMHEHVFAAISRLDETIPLCRVEPFHIAGRHHCSPECPRRAVLARVVAAFQQEFHPPHGGPRSRAAFRF